MVYVEPQLRRCMWLELVSPLRHALAYRSLKDAEMCGISWLALTSTIGKVQSFELKCLQRR